MRARARVGISHVTATGEVRVEAGELIPDGVPASAVQALIEAEQAQPVPDPAADDEGTTVTVMRPARRRPGGNDV